MSKVFNDYKSLKGHNNLQKVKVVFFALFLSKEIQPFEGRIGFCQRSEASDICLAFYFLLSLMLPFLNFKVTP